jgi:ATP-dependent Lon protease
VLIPKDNEKDLAEIPDNARRGLEIIPLDTVDEILRLALVTEPTPIEWPEPSEVEAARSVQDKGEHSGLVRH